MVGELIHQLSLAPGVAVLIRGPGKLAPGFILLALAFAVSYPIDSIAKLTGGSWVGFYALIPLQIALALFAVETDRRRRWLAIPPLAAMIPISVALSFPGPEVLMMVVGSVAILVLAKGPLRWPVLIYFGIGSFFYVPMVMGSEFMQWWNPYQASRVCAGLLFIALVFTCKETGGGA